MSNRRNSVRPQLLFAWGAMLHQPNIRVGMYPGRDNLLPRRPPRQGVLRAIRKMLPIFVLSERSERGLWARSSNTLRLTRGCYELAQELLCLVVGMGGEHRLQWWDRTRLAHLPYPSTGASRPS